MLSVMGQPVCLEPREDDIKGFVEQVSGRIRFDSVIVEFVRRDAASDAEFAEQKDKAQSSET